MRIAFVLAACAVVSWADADLDHEIEQFLAQEPAPKAEKPWDISAFFGLTITSGNSDTMTITGGFDATRDYFDWKLTLKERSIYSENEGVQSANRHIFTEATY